jgi:integrase
MERSISPNAATPSAATRWPALRGRSAPGRDLTLGELFDIYAEEVTPQKGVSKQRHDEGAAEMFARRFGAVGDRVIAYHLKFLLSVLNWATVAGDGEGGVLLDRNPLKGFALPSEDAPRRVVMVSEEYDALLKIASDVHPDFECLLVLAHETGHRLSSIGQLRWSDVDMERRLVRWRAVPDKIGFEHSTPPYGDGGRAFGGPAAPRAGHWRRVRVPIGRTAFGTTPEDYVRKVVAARGNASWA